MTKPGFKKIVPKKNEPSWGPLSGQSRHHEIILLPGGEKRVKIPSGFNRPIMKKSPLFLKEDIPV